MSTKTNHRAAVHRVFTRQHGLILRGDAVRWIEDMLAHYEVAPDDVNDTLEVLAKECEAGATAGDSSTFVDQDLLQRVYDRLQVSTATSEQLQHLSASQGGAAAGPDAAHLDESQYFRLVNAFSMPLWRWNAELNRGFEKDPKQKLLGQMASKPKYQRDRYNIIRQVILRNEHFSPPALPGAGGDEREEYMKLTSVNNMLGRAGQRFLLFGLLGRLPDGAFSLEDPDGVVELDLREATPAEGLFTEGSLVLVEGEYMPDETFRVLEIGHPPSEQREVSRKMFAHVDFTGAGAMSLAEETALRKREALSEAQILVLSDLHLDNPKVLPSLRKILQGYADLEASGDAAPPPVWVLCGNFSERPFLFDGPSLTHYQGLFAKLADTLASFPALLSSCKFILVPGPTDPFDSNLLPRHPLPSGLLKPLLASPNKIPPGSVMAASNPCRIRWLSQEIVVFREDLMRKMGRNVVGALQRAEAEGEDVDMRKYLVQSILDQAHLSPLPINVRPILWEHDQALRLYPMPTALVLADASAQYDLTYEGCHVFNPGSFVGSRMGWATYHVATRSSETSELAD